MSERKKIIVLSTFCIAMAGLESAVVIYLRALYYPDGFSVVLRIIDLQILLVEIFRELTTVVMLVAVAYLVGKKFNDRFAYFLFAFAVWDIFYYVWLKVFLDWPETLLDWDILFLIPITWLSPVLAPIICSATMLYFYFVIMKDPDKSISVITNSLLTIGCLFILYTFMKDYGSLILEYGFVLNADLIEVAKARIPQPYSWFVFATGEIFLLAGILKHRFQ